MFQSHRKFKTCVLCGRHDLTKEHIFGKSFAAHLNVTENWTALATPDLPLPLPGKTVRGSSPITSIAPRLLCAKCNNERLSGLMNESLPYLKDLSSGNSISFQPPEITLIQRYFGRIGLIVDVCTSNEQLKSQYKETSEHKLAAKFRKEPAIIDFAQRQAWLAGGPLVEMSISLGHHIGVLGLNPDVNIAHYSVLRNGVKGREMYPAKRVSLVIKQIAVCIDIGMGPAHLPNSLAAIDKLTNWPINPKITYDEYFSLRTQDQLTHRLRLLVQNPQFVMGIEELSWQKGTFTIPDEI